MNQHENDKNYKKESTPVVGKKPYGKYQLIVVRNFKGAMKIRHCRKSSNFLAFLLPAIAAVLLLAPSCARAQANWLQFQFIVSALGGPGNPNYDSGKVQSAGVLVTNISIFPSGDRCDAIVNATANYGALSFNASCAVNDDPSNGSGYSARFGNSVVSFQDTLTITSATLPAGTPVQIQIASVWSGSVSPSFSISGYDDGADASASLNLQVWTYVTGGQTYSSDVGVTWQTNTLSEVFITKIGDGVVMIPNITAIGDAYNDDGNSFNGSATASVASQTYVDVLTPGAGYTSGSGTVYPTLIPTTPTLSIQPTVNGVTLLWPVSTTVYRLQQNTDLATANWVSNTIPINVVNGTNQVTVSPATGNLFFRLINP
jgi:hypothetical protein